MQVTIDRREFMVLAGAAVAAAALPGKVYTAAAGCLQCGVARVDITPPVGCWLSGYAARKKPSVGVADKLSAKAVCLSDGKTEIAIVSTDLIGVTARLVSAVRRSLERKTGIPGANILIAATHTHFGPVVREYTFNPGPDPAYIKTLREKLTRLVMKAHGNLTGVSVGAARGEAGELLYNRRPRGKDGKAVMTWVLPSEEPGLTFGPVDPAVGVFRVEDNTGKLVCALINFACHPVAGGKDMFYQISADYPGHATGVVEQVEGGICLFTLGAAGNMNPVKRGRLARLRTGRALGGEALRRLQLLSTTGEARLAAVRRAVTLPMKTEIAADANQKPSPGQTEITTEIQGLRIGDTVLLGLPGEVLVELGLEIKKKAGVENLFLISLANDAVGYICHHRAYESGGYEPGRGTLLARGAGEIVVQEALQTIEQLKQKG